MRKNTFRPKLPVHMVWLSTNACNARCLHCSSNSSVRTYDELTQDEVFSLIDQFADAGVMDLAISGGEPLIRPDIFEIIGYARGRGMSVGLGSNGATLTTRQATRLAASGINRFQVSLDGFEDQHDGLRQWPGLFKRALSTIDTVANLGIRTHVCCTINRLNVHSIEAFAEFLCSTRVKRLNLSRYVPTGRGNDFLDLDQTEWQNVLKMCVNLKTKLSGRLEIVTHLAQQILVDDDVQQMRGYTGCQAGCAQGCVTANGTVLPCVLLPLAIGNVRNSGFEEIWRNSPIIRNLQIRDTLSGECGSCSFNKKCGGCRAVAYAKTGDYLASDPRCEFVSPGNLITPLPLRR